MAKYKVKLEVKECEVCNGVGFNEEKEKQCEVCGGSGLAEAKKKKE